MADMAVITACIDLDAVTCQERLISYELNRQRQPGFRCQADRRGMSAR